MSAENPIFVDDYPLARVERALRSMTITPKARALLVAQATTENRAMSRLELSRAVGGRNVNTVNSSYGSFAKKLALAIDPALESQWKPADGGGGDFVMFLNFGPRRWTTPIEGEPDPWVFVMRETFARALAGVGIAPYTQLADFLTGNGAESANDVAGADAEGDDTEDDDGPSNPIFDIDDAEDQLESLSDTERVSVILARIGQGQFRQSLLDYWEGKCAVTGVPIAPALVASHIKPWRLANNAERLDVYNGLLLVGTLDRLFDVGLIAFTDAGVMLIHESINTAARATLGLSRPLRLRSVHAKHRPFLREHRGLFGFKR